MFSLLVIAATVWSASFAVPTTNETTQEPTNAPETTLPTLAPLLTGQDEFQPPPGSNPDMGSVEIPGDAEVLHNAASISHILLKPTDNDCKDVRIEFAVPPIQGSMELNGEFCNPPGGDWALGAGVNLKALGNSLINDKFRFGPRNNEINRSLNLLAAKANVILGVYDGCIRVRGHACYWGFKWRCTDFDETPHCFRDNRAYIAYSLPKPDVGSECEARLKKIAALTHMEL